MDASWITNSSSQRNNEAIHGMINLFLSCQRCSQVTLNPKQLKCSHTICVRCALRHRTRNLHGGFWTLECTACYAVEAWRDGAGELSGLASNMLMQQISNQIEPQIDAPNDTKLKSEKFEYASTDLSTTNRQFHTDIVTAIKEKIEVQEAVHFARKKMEKCQRQARYVKSYERKVETNKNALVQKITQATELLVANVMEEKARLLAKLEEMFQEEMRPASLARENINKQSQSLEILTRCCDVATQMTQHDTAAIDLVLFKDIVRRNMEDVNKFTLPPGIRRKYKSNVSLTCDCDSYGDMVRDFVKIGWRPGLTSTDECERTVFNNENDTRNMDEQPIYDLPPEFENAKEQEKEDANTPDEIVYDEIPAEYINLAQQYAERPMPSPPRPPKSVHLQNQTAAHMARDLAEKVREFENQKTGSSHIADFEFEYDSSDSFSSDEDDSADSLAVPPEQTETDSQTAKTIPHESGLGTIRRYLSRKHSKISRKDTDSGTSNQSGSDLTNESSPKQVRRALSVRNMLFRSNSCLSKAPASANFIFSIGRVRKVGSKEAFSQPPEIFADKQGKIWIYDAANYAVQAYDGSNGKPILSFKTVLNGVRMKARGITSVNDGSQIATSCGKYVIVWDHQGKFLRKYGPRSDVGKLGGVAVDRTGNLILADVDNAQIVFENKGTVISNICSQKAGKQTWPGRIAANSDDQIITAEYNEHCVKVFSTDGHLVIKFGSFGAEKGQMRYPSGVAVDKQNRIYVADECNSRITVFSADGSSSFGDVLTREDGIKFPHSLALLPNGNIAVSDESKLVKVYKGLDT